MRATATVTTCASNLVTAAMMFAKNVVCLANRIPSIPSPAMGNVVDRLRAAAGVIVFVHIRLMTAVLMSVMNATLAAGRKRADGGFRSWCWGIF